MDTHDPRRPHNDAVESVDEIDELFAGAFPNPEREGCPGREVLTRLARERASMDDPVYEHLQRCSPCYIEFRELQRAFAGSPRAESAPVGSQAAPRSRWLLVGLAAVLLLLTISAAVWRTWFAETSQPVAVQAEFDLRPYGANRGDGGNGAKPLVVRRGVIALVLILPTGSEPGKYDIQILDSDLNSILSVTAQAEMRQYQTELRTELPLSAVRPGRYQLAIRYGSERWRLFPLEVS
jgi:hypothetical protein